MTESAIGIFDSGVGGVSVLALAERALPHESFLYYADTAHFPYGDASPQTVRDGVFRAAETMLARGAKALVIACNTATSIAIDELRASFDVPILGIEPAVKPAIQRCAGKRIGVIATSLTLREKKFLRLFEEFRARGELLILPSPGLADLVERGDYHTPAADQYIRRLFAEAGPLDGVVLGCTHYMFVLPAVERLYPHAAILDGGPGTVRHLAHILGERKLLASGEKRPTEVLSSAPEIFLPRFARAHDDIEVILAAAAHKLE